MEREIPCLVVAKGLARKGLLERGYWKEFTGKALLERACDWSLAIEGFSKGISGCPSEE